MRLPFAKVESIGNDFVLVEASQLTSATDEALRVLAIKVCERRFSVGSDGLLIIGPDLASETEHRIVLRMFNPDGTEDFCGNGLRCASLYAQSSGWSGSRTEILHGGKLIDAEVASSGRVRTELGTASFRPQGVPLDECSGELFMASLELEDAELVVSSLTTGSTHTVILCDDLPDDPDFQRISSALEHHPLFPMRTSVIWAREKAAHGALTGESQSLKTQQSILSTLQIRIWERGAGETLGCGTGSAAAAVVQMRRMGLGGTIAVENPGGQVLISADRWDMPISTEGSAQIVYRGVLDIMYH